VSHNGWWCNFGEDFVFTFAILNMQYGNLHNSLVQNTHLTSAFNDGQKQKRRYPKRGGFFVNK